MKQIIFLLAIYAMSHSNTFAQYSSSKEVATPELAAQREIIKQGTIENYMQVRKALIVSDSLNAAKYAAQFAASLEKFKFKKLTLEEMNAATTIRGQVKQLAQQIAGITKISQQRKLFAQMSDQFWKIADKVKPLNEKLFLQACTMTGETWISDKEEIENPIYPKNMLTCGIVKAKID